jgi:hypothetical protein
MTKYEMMRSEVKRANHLLSAASQGHIIHLQKREMYQFNIVEGLSPPTHLGYPGSLHPVKGLSLSSSYPLHGDRTSSNTPKDLIASCRGEGKEAEISERDL